MCARDSSCSRLARQRVSCTLLRSSLACAGIGCHIYHSTDGGKTFQNLSDNVRQQVDLGAHTPVPYFAEQGAVLGTNSGKLFASPDPASGPWKPLWQVPGAVLTIAADGCSSSSVIH